MKNAGKATQAAIKLVYWSLFLLLALLLASVLARLLGAFIVHIASGLTALWFSFCLFCFYFFRDPEPEPPADPQAIVAPAHGTVDVIDEIEAPDFIGGRCRRIAIFLSVFDVHVQHAPVAGRVIVSRYTAGQFRNAMRTDSAAFNENVLMGFESPQAGGTKIGVRLIAGLIARRIVPWVNVGEVVERGDRISLIQFGSRCEVYLPLNVRVQIALQQHVRGGETVLAHWS